MLNPGLLPPPPPQVTWGNSSGIHTGIGYSLALGYHWLDLSLGSRQVAWGKGGNREEGSQWGGFFPRSPTGDLSKPFHLGQVRRAGGHCHLLATGCNSCITVWLN